MVNPGVDGCTEIPINGKTHKNGKRRQLTWNQRNNKTEM